MPQERPVASPLSGNDWHDVNGRNAKRHMTTVVTSSAPTQHNLGEMEREGTQQRAQLSSYTGRTLQERALTDIRDNVPSRNIGHLSYLFRQNRASSQPLPLYSSNAPPQQPPHPGQERSAQDPTPPLSQSSKGTPHPRTHPNLHPSFVSSGAPPRSPSTYAPPKSFTGISRSRSLPSLRIVHRDSLPKTSLHHPPQLWILHRDVQLKAPPQYGPEPSEVPPLLAPVPLLDSNNPHKPPQKSPARAPVQVNPSSVHSDLLLNLVLTPPQA
ncbi:hypothetical protein C1H76_3040 [Elsinoe australis]|uniref:Uncharacterized protein n=1 Tax=Elsinoe australis TaxID=40998 RepID=A0A4U7B8G3_9PEZI|nr:hypothetical protein C1H76_3040 [Elsinoe australis]